MRELTIEIEPALMQQAVDAVIAAFKEVGVEVHYNPVDQTVSVPKGVDRRFHFNAYRIACITGHIEPLSYEEWEPRFERANGYLT